MSHADDDDEKQVGLWIKQAESISTSGRWAKLNEHVVRLGTDERLRIQHFEGKENDWMFVVFSALLCQVLEEYQDLKKASEEKTKIKLSEVAWRSRNLSELFIWIAYCSSDAGRAKRFYEDAGRDMQSLADSFIKWGVATKQDELWLKNFSNAKEDLKTKMMSRGMANLEDGYTKVAEAAKELGLEDSFRIENRMLSKFAHPTAAFIMRPTNEDFEVRLRDSFFGQACLHFCAAFDILEIWLGEQKKEAA